MKSSENDLIPQILLQLLEVALHADDDLSWEASLALKFFFERECINGDSEWLSNVEDFLYFRVSLADEIGEESIVALKIEPNIRDKFAFQVFGNIETGAKNAWKCAFILKQAICVPGLEATVISYLSEHWRKDEVVSLHLLSVIWSPEDAETYMVLLKEMAETASSSELKSQASQHLRTQIELSSQKSS